MAAAEGARERLGYRPGLDGIRAIAVCAVIGFHYYRWPVGGNAGVELFFVLSGFLITTLLMEEWQKNGRIQLGRFYARRALRLFPALWVYLAVVAAVTYSIQAFDGPSLLYGFTYTTNIATVAGRSVGWFPHLWSLAVEEQFYLVWPLLLILMLGRRWPLARILSAAALLALVVVALRDTSTFGYAGFAYFKFDAILAGCIAGLLFTSRHRGMLVRACCVPPVPLIAAAWLVYSLIRPDYSLDIGGWVAYWTLFNIAAAVTIVWVVEGCPRIPPARWLVTVAPVMYLGRISYALYLWHPFVRFWLVWPTGGNVKPGLELNLLEPAGALVFASGSYWLVERPFLRIKWRLSATGSHDADAAVILTHNYEGESPAKEPAGAS